MRHDCPIHHTRQNCLQIYLGTGFDIRDVEIKVVALGSRISLAGGRLDDRECRMRGVQTDQLAKLLCGRMPARAGDEGGASTAGQRDWIRKAGKDEDWGEGS